RVEIIYRHPPAAHNRGDTSTSPHPVAGEAPVSSAGSATTWVEQLRAGNHAAAHGLRARYCPCPPSLTGSDKTPICLYISAGFGGFVRARKVLPYLDAESSR